jgi:hypothetical protein
MLSREWQRELARLEADPALLDPERVRERIEVLDRLEAELGCADLHGLEFDGLDASIQERAWALRNKLESANAEFYRLSRAEIRSDAGSDVLRQRFHSWLGWKDGQLASPGLSYDYRDELLSGILGIREPVLAQHGLERGDASAEMVFYQPTPARHIFDFIWASGLGDDDVLLDLGSGLGHVPMLASMLTGARSVGFEVEPAYVECARECAEGLGLKRVTFIQQDAREADVSEGTVFFLYTPFSGSILSTVLDKLREESLKRRIRICTFGPCTAVVAKAAWLSRTGVADAERVTVFQAGY